MHSTNLFTIADASYRNELRAKFLADAIPATSFAAGANFTGGGLENYDMLSKALNGWPRNKGKWLHSDIKDVSYYYCYNLFLFVIQGGSPNAP